MGTTLSNLQIRRCSLDEAAKLVPGSLIRQFNPQWTTITSPDFHVGAMDRIARRVSKQTESAVLSVEVFDEDILILQVFRRGKRVASHVSTTAYGRHRIAGNPAAFVRELELPESYVEYLKWVFKCEDLGKEIELLQSMGIPLWIDHRMLADLQNDSGGFALDLSSVEDYVNRQKALSKIKNVTKARLLMEFDGKVRPQWQHWDRMWLVQEPCPDGNYRSNQGYYVYEAQPNGLLEPLLSVSHFRPDAGTKIVANDHAFAVLEPWGKEKRTESSWLGLVVAVTQPGDEWRLSLYNREGRLIAEPKVLDKPGHLVALAEDGSVICASHTGDLRTIRKYGADGLKMWEIETGYLFVEPVIRNGYIYLHREDPRDHQRSEILKIDPTGETVASLSLDHRGGGHWRTFIFDEAGGFYHCVSAGDKGRHGKILHLDAGLCVKSETILSGSSFKGMLDPENKRLYVYVFEQQLVALDTERDAICAQKRHDEFLSIWCVDAKGRLTIGIGSSTVEVFDSHLDVVSRHRLKGFIWDAYRDAAGNACFLTLDMPEHAYSSDNVKSTLRVYAIQ